MRFVGFFVDALFFKTIVCVCVIFWVPLHQVPIWGHLTGFTYINISLSISLLELYIGCQPTVLTLEEERRVSHHVEKDDFPDSRSSVTGPSQKLPIVSSSLKYFSLPVSIMQ